MDHILHDVRYAFRSLRKSPGFTLVAVLTLALGIGANTAIFSVLERAVLNPVPWPEADRLVVVGWSWGGPGGTASLAPGKAEFWKENGDDFFEASTITSGANFVLTGGGAEPEQLIAGLVSDGYFRTIGMEPALGRGFTAEEDEPGGPNVVVIGDGLWRRRFGADPGVVGRTVTLSGQSYTVVGVMPPEYRAAGYDLLTPLQLVVDPNDQGHNYFFLARLAPGTSFERVETGLEAMGARFRAIAPYEIQPQEHFRLVGYLDYVVGGTGTIVWILFGAVGFVLLIACANVANLLLGRTAARKTETAVRVALGAGRGRILRHLLVESVLLAAAGGLLGLLLAAWGLTALLASAPASVLDVGEVGLSLPVLGFCLAVSLLTGIGVGLVGALHAMRPDLMGTLKEGGRSRAAGRGRLRARGLLVMAEAALSVVLLVGAGLLIVSFFQLRGVELGFDPEGVYTVELQLPPERYGTTAETWGFERQVLERVEGLPGVTAAGTASSLPLVRGLNIRVSVDAPGVPRVGTMEYRAVSPDFLRVLGVTLLRGRGFTEADDAGAPPVALVNEAFARRYFAEEEPIGGRISVVSEMEEGTEGVEEPQRTIVGVIGDITDIDLREEARPTVFVPRAQTGDALTRSMNSWFPTAFALRTSNPEAAGAALRRAIGELDPQQPILRFRPMTEVVAASVAGERFNMVLLGIFAGLALLLTAIGIYGVISYTVRQRTQEIGIRMALGARRGAVLGMVVRQGMVVTGIGIGVGVAAAFALTRLISGMLYGVSATDPATFVAVALLLAAVALLACWLPARRATRVDPMVALRSE